MNIIEKAARNWIARQDDGVATKEDWELLLEAFREHELNEKGWDEMFLAIREGRTESQWRVGLTCKGMATGEMSVVVTAATGSMAAGMARDLTKQVLNSAWGWSEPELESSTVTVESVEEEKS